MKQRMFLIVITLAAATVLSGCWPFPSQKQVGEKIMEKAIEAQTGGKVNVDADKETMSINTNEGLVTAGKEAKIPDNFPKDIFMYSDAKIMFAMSGTSGGNSFSVSYNTSTSPEDAFLKYKDEMVKNGWTKETELDMGAQGKMLNFKKGILSVGVTMGVSQDTENAGKTTVTVSGGEDNNPPVPAGEESQAGGASPE